MAFYKDAPGHKPEKRRFEKEGKWEEEGSSYRGARNSRSAHSAGKSSFGEKNGTRGYGHGNQRGDRNAAPARRFGPGSSERPSFRREDRTEEAPRFGRPAVTENKPKTYRDFEHRQPARPVEAVEMAEREETVDMSAYLLTGRNPIREAIRTGRDLEKLMVLKGELSGSAREIVAMAKEKHIIVQEVEKNRLDEITAHHQGMIAIASAYQYSTVEEMLALAEERGEAPFLILLDGITDPHNLGAIIRSAECTGAHGVIVPERRSVGLTPAAVKASAGAVEHMKVARVTNLTRTIDELKEKNIWTYALTMDGQDYEKTSFDGGTALVVGSEGEGISRLTMEHCDVRVSLPMKGHIDSLNASVAAAVMMYRVLSSRRS